MFDLPHDARVRTAAFEWLSAQVAKHGDVLPRNILADGFTFEGLRVPLVGPQGILKSKVLYGAPLSITTAPAGPWLCINKYDEVIGWQ
jgi:putative restriction endonuclease